jgi:hypothetical protein
MIAYNDYRAAVERLRRVESGQYCRVVYEEDDFGEHYDKLTVYDAEHDPTPATVEWLREVGLEAIDEGLCAFGMLQVLIEDDGSYAMLYDGQESMVFKDNPTRGDVLTALRLFSKKEGA